MLKFLRENIDKFILFILTLFLANSAFAENISAPCYFSPGPFFYCAVFDGFLYQNASLGDIIVRITALFVGSVLALLAIVYLKTKISHNAYFQKADHRKLFRMFLKANIVSSLIIFLLALISSRLILFFPLLCYIMEYLITRKILLEQYKTKSIVDGLIKINLIFLILSPVIVFIVIASIVGL